MPTNRNEPVWSSGPRVLTGGGNGALIVVPADQDLFDVTLTVAAATTAQVEVTHDSYEAILGINERPLRYPQAAINDLGGSGELRMNAASGADFTDDGWAVGDTFELLSHRAPKFGPEGTHPTTLGDGQVYTVTSVAADVLAFSEDPAITLAEGDVSVSQSRAAVAEDSLSWAQVGSDVAGAATDHFNISTACAARVVTSAGTGQIDYNFAGRMQSVIRPAPFVVHANPSPLMGIGTGKAMLPLVSVPDGQVVVWDEKVTGGPNGSRRQARAQVAGANFESDGLQNFDRVFVGGHSVTGNNGLYVVDSRLVDVVTFKEPLKGVAGTDTPGRSKWRYLPATLGPGGLPSDYEELVLGDMGVTAGSFFKMQDAVISPLTDSGPQANADMIAKDPGISVDVVGPWPGSRGIENPAGLEFRDFVGDKDYFGAGKVGTYEGWYRHDTQTGTQNLMLSTDGPRISVTSATDFIRLLIDGPTIAQPSDWAGNTVYASGARVNDPGASSTLYENESAGSRSAAVSAGTQEVDVANLKALATATGLANDATVYTAAVVVDGGGSEPISVVGSAAQTYTALISELDTDTTCSWSLVDGNLVATSPTTGESSTIAITDTDIFLTLTSFVAVNAAVAGDGEPTWPTGGGTTVDGALVAGFQDGDYGALLLGATATGLVNDSTVYTAAVVVDGGSSQPIAVTGSTAQTYTTLLAELNTDTTGATWSLKNGELRCTSDTTGDTSTVAITDTDLLSTLTDFVSLNTAVPGANLATWRDVGFRSSFHTTSHANGTFIPPITGDWFHIATVRDANGDFKTYVNGVEDTGAAHAVPTPDTVPGSFGSPLAHDLATDLSPGSGTGSSGNGFTLGGSGVDGEEQWRGAMAFVAIYEGVALTPAQILAHYNLGVALGLNT